MCVNRGSVLSFLAARFAIDKDELNPNSHLSITKIYTYHTIFIFHRTVKLHFLIENSVRDETGKYRN